MIAWVIVVALTATFAHASESPCLPKGKNWMTSQSISGHFGFTADQLTAQIAHPPVKGRAVDQTNEAMLAIVSAKGLCLAKILGNRPSGEAKVPFFKSTGKAVSLKEGVDLIQVTSTYSHGFTEAITTLFRFDSAKKQLIDLWHDKTLEGSPNGDIEKSEVKFEDFNHDGYNDLVVTRPDGKIDRWTWNLSRQSFDPKSGQ